MSVETPLLEATARCLARYDAHTGGGTLLAAVSGGRDSTLLAWLLAELRRTGRLTAPICIGHVDHGVHEASADAAVHVAELSARLGLEFRSERLVDVAPTEAALRDARYDALIRMARHAGARIILTAHHADDNLETVLFRMMRGTGPRGLAGIPESRRLADNIRVVRPFLVARRATLVEILDRLDLPVIEDPTNRDVAYARNRLRHEVIPRLRRTVGDHLDESLLTLADQARRLQTLLDVQAARILRDEARFLTPWRCELVLPRQNDGRRVFLQEAVSRIHAELHPNRRRPRFAWVERALDLRVRDAGRRVGGRGQVWVERTRAGLLFTNPAGAGTAPTAPVELPADGHVRFGTTEWVVHSRPRDEPPLAPSPGIQATAAAGAPISEPVIAGLVVTGHVVIDPREAPRPWRLRPRRSGDRFWPLGAAGPLDLRRFMQNRRVPRFDRDRLPLVVDAADRLLWIPGVELTERNAIRLDSEACFELKLSIVGSDTGRLTPY